MDGQQMGNEASFPIHCPIHQCPVMGNELIADSWPIYIAHSLAILFIANSLGIIIANELAMNKIANEWAMKMGHAN